MSFNRGDVVIALFPHADGSPPKPRPVMVVQSDAYNAKFKNLIVAAITPPGMLISTPNTNDVADWLSISGRRI